MTKKEIRQFYNSQRRKLSDDEKLSAAQRVMSQLINNERISNCRDILIYWSLPDELPTPLIIKELSTNHNIYLPVIVGREIEFRRFEGESELQAESKFGIGEPTCGELWNADEDSSVIIVPGVAFTRDGKRLGRGGGFYDRFFAQHRHIYKIGIAFACQIADELPTDEHDVAMNTVIVG